MDNLEYTGIWWLPESPNDETSGTLTFDPVEGAQLDLVGSLRELQQLGRDFNPELVHGFTSDGKKITLYNCIESHTEISFPGFIHSKYSAQCIFVGHHFKNTGDLQFDSIHINYLYLEHWAGLTGFNRQLEYGKDGLFTKDTITFAQPQELSVSVDGLTISLACFYHPDTDNVSDFHLLQTTYFKVASKSPLTFEYITDKINYLLQSLVTFGSGKTAFPTELSLSNPTLNEDSDTKSDSPKWIKVYYRLGQHLNPQDKLKTRDFFFTLSDISSQYSSFLQNWFSKDSLLRPVFDLYFSTLNSPSMYLNHEFLNLIHALEAFHRRTLGGTYFSEDEYASTSSKIINSLPADLQSEFRNSLVQKIHYANEYSLRKRFNIILNRLGPLLDRIVRDKRSFTENVVATRNYLTHHEKSEGTTILEGADLYWATRRIKAILEVSILLEMGLTQQLIDNFLKRNNHYRVLLPK